MDDAATGCGGIVVFFVIFWGIFHFSGYSVLVGRSEGRYSTDMVWAECFFLNSTGIENVRQPFSTPEWRDRFYCPRTKKVGEWPAGK